MPVVFEPTDVLHLDRYGQFRMWRYPGFMIPADKAVSITADDTNKWTEPFRGAPYHAKDHFPIRPHLGIEQWGAIIERFNWGQTSVPDMVYYELYTFGKVLPVLIEGYYCGTKIGMADIENRSTHPVAAEKLELRFWNCSADAPRNVWIEVAVWLYWFPMENLPILLEISDISLMQEMNQRHSAVLNELIKLRQLVERSPELLVTK